MNVKPHRIPFGTSLLALGRPAGPGQIRCHIKECAELVTRPTDANPYPPDSLCKSHGIYVHPTTYRYADWHQNLLWPSDDKRADWYAANKREGRGTDKAKATHTRLGHEGSEDAVTWNVFRTIERAGKTNELLPILTGGAVPATPCDMYLWTLEYAIGIWPEFASASRLFGEVELKGTEVDVILHARDKALVYVEAKFGSTNEREQEIKQVYRLHPWFSQVLNPSARGHYQLVRNWLLGTWMAAELKVPFWLISLVRASDSKELGIGEEFGRRMCCQKVDRTFCRRTWEELGELAVHKLLEPEKSALEQYFREKTLNLAKAFNPLSIHSPEG